MKLSLSSLARAFVFIAMFAIGACTYTVMYHLIAANDTIIRLVMLGIFAFIGSFFFSEQHAISRLASVFTLLFLGTVAFELGHVIIEPSYLLLLAVIAAGLGSLPFLHRTPSEIKHPVITKLLIITISLTSIGVFTYITTALRHFTEQL